MGGPKHNVLGLVELADSDDDIGIQGAAYASVLRDVFHDRLKTWVRPKDQWRLLNNNRVCVILKDIGSQGELELAAAKLGRIFQEPLYHRGRSIPLAVTVGFAELDNPDSGMKLAMQQAGLALKQARKSSQLFDVYSPQCALDDDSEQQLVKRLETALERGELQLYYQPKVHAGYQSLIGAEALMRWHTPDREVIMPGQFIEIAERHEIIKPITRWAIKSAVARLARWPQQLSIAVNISPALLLSNEIHSVVKDALEIHGVEPARLNLEVTESIMVDNQNIMLSQLAQLRELGVKISLDDFGTGFSSLAYFRDLPVDEIKIDQSFVLRMLESEKDHAIVKAVIDLAHNFSMKVVAEGVETLEIAKRLADLRCDVLQGYVFDRPLPVEEFERQYRV
jgi:EAL domain-containing protein (putative c-di-GMP-specific phosphodiesterase class I)